VSLLIKVLCLDRCLRDRLKFVKDQRILDKGTEKLEEKLEIQYLIKKLNDVEHFELQLDSESEESVASNEDVNVKRKGETS